MFNNDHQLTTVSIILPPEAADQVAQQVTASKGTHLLSWPARGTLLQEHWLKRWVPPISPAKTMMQMVVPNSQVDNIISLVVDVGKLNRQATGAVFSTPHAHAYLGSKFHVWPGQETPFDPHQGLRSSLSVIYCIVSHAISDRVSKAAVRAGAHGPVVYYCEGRGLRDRLGWLRITKEHEKEVISVICDDADVEDIFDAMAQAGELHLPGRGFMFRLNIDKGMFNLPSRMAHHHHDASMQQIINAIDHLQGHQHWRDQSAFNIGPQGRAAGVALGGDTPAQAQTCFTAIIARAQMETLINLFLDQGATGMNFSFARYIDFEELRQSDNLSVNDEYVLMRTIVPTAAAEQMAHSIEAQAPRLGLDDVCLLVSDVAHIATYVPSRTDYRQTTQSATG